MLPPGAFLNTVDFFSWHVKPFVARLAETSQWHTLKAEAPAEQRNHVRPCPQVPEIAQIYKTDPGRYEDLAKEWTRKYAM